MKRDTDYGFYFRRDADFLLPKRHRAASRSSVHMVPPNPSWAQRRGEPTLDIMEPT